ncbi:secreted protein [Plectosphaerella cucumerina]|uniref:Secreted protein n=1 Tax=Plectosphaerella cucumerina TaxID=40658 RepID=A0A8K0T853_9PEZI|nr:secreted protein [Plectosphaerella cucumerina]
MSLSTLVQGALGGAYEAFQTPPMRARPMFRWWWPDGLVDPEEIRTEVRQMYDGGFGGAEISDVHRGRNTPIDLENYGWGSEPFVDGIYAAAAEAEPLGFYIDNTVGPTYPASVPGLTHDDPAALREVVLGRVVVQNGEAYSGPVPPPGRAAHGTVKNETLLAVHAYKVNSRSTPTASPIIIDHDSLISLSCLVKDGNIRFTPPDNATWILMSWYHRGAGMNAKGGPHNHEEGSVIDHFSARGTQAMIDFWEDNILNPEVKDLLSAIGGAFFEDSIELEYNTLWSYDFRDEFKERQGYDILRYLPAVTQDDQKNVFRFSDEELNRGVINDFWDTLGKMYVDNHVGVLKPWANEFNYRYRAQVYGIPTDSMSAVAKIDIPEGESLGFKNLGDWRSLAGAANFANLKVIGNEACAFLGLSYQLGWELMLQTINPIMTAGINLQVLHGFAYKEAPGAKWPGFAAFTPYGRNGVGYSEAWGPRIPMWKHVRDFSGYLSRVQALLQRGQPKHDVAFLSPKGYIAAGFSGIYFHADGARNGWSMNLVGPAQFREPTAFVEDKKLHPRGPGYTVVAFEGDSFANRAPVIELDTAERILDYAKQGVTVLIIGNWTVPRAFHFREFDQNAKIKTIIDELLTLPNVHNPSTREDIPAYIAKVPVKPRVQYDNQQLLNYHRVDGDVEHFYFTATHTDIYQVRANLRIQPVLADVLIPRPNAKYVPFWMDPWTGNVVPVADYEEVSDTQIKLHLDIPAYSSAFVSIAPLDAPPVHALSSPGGAGTRVFRTDDGLFLRSNQSGTYTTELSTGSSVETVIDSIPAVVELGSWSLSVESWGPTDDILSPETVKTRSEHTLSTLVPWTEIDGLADVAGIGNYTTSFDLPSSWDATAHGAFLAVPKFIGSLRVFVNGLWLGPVDQLGVEFDISPLLKAGSNEVVLEVATNLINKLRIVDPDVYAVVVRQAHGLVGTLEVKPYAIAKIAE